MFQKQGVDHSAEHCGRSHLCGRDHTGHHHLSVTPRQVSGEQESRGTLGQRHTGVDRRKRLAYNIMEFKCYFV